MIQIVVAESAVVEAYGKVEARVVEVALKYEEITLSPKNPIPDTDSFQFGELVPIPTFPISTPDEFIASIRLPATEPGVDPAPAIPPAIYTFAPFPPTSAELPPVPPYISATPPAPPVPTPLPPPVPPTKIILPPTVPSVPPLDLPEPPYTARPGMASPD